jgi:hypothetical protein
VSELNAGHGDVIVAALAVTPAGASTSPSAGRSASSIS